jgi:LacI family transcriptional regulator
LVDFYHGVILDSLRHAFEATESIGELVIQRCRTVKDLDRINTDAFICFHPARDSFPHLEELAQRKPIVALGGSVQDTSLYCVDCQNAIAIRRAIRHLIELGHERIALVNGPLSSTNCFDRQQGYIEELKANELEVRPGDVFNANSIRSLGGMTGKLSRLMRNPNRPTAIIACSYYLALDVMILLRRLPLRIPQDVSLVGFDDPKSASLLNPSLTTIHQPLEDMGARAYQRIVQLIHGRTPSTTLELLPTSLIVRESTGIAS